MVLNALRQNSRVVLPLAVLLGSALIFFSLSFFRPDPAVRAKTERGVLVETMLVEKGNAPIEIEGNGNVQPLRQVSISAEVPGRVEWVAPELVRGGFVSKGETLYRIQAEDYRLRLASAQAEIARAEQELNVVQANASVADEEWELVQKLGSANDEAEGSAKRSALQMFTPQLKTARAALAAAKAGARQAKINLERTEVKAPFNSFVLEKHIELGQYVTLGQKALELVGTDAVEVFVPVTASQSRWLGRAMSQNNKDSLSAVVETKIDQEVLRWDGFVDRVLAEVDPKGRMHRAVVRVANPYFQPDKGERHIVPLSVGTFVRIKIAAGMLADVYQVPRSALREKQTLWVADTDNRLRIREVSIARRDSEFAYVNKGLTQGDRLILSPISGAVEGLLVRVSDTEGGASS